MANNKKNNNESANTVKNETKVVCPVCGSEFAIGEHEHKVRNATVIGQDSGLGTVYMPVSKRGEALKAAGVDTSKYFSITLPNGNSQLMQMNEEGNAVPVSQDDPIVQTIINGGTVPNRNLFRRWVMSQVFHGLMDRDGYTHWITRHGYVYSWDMLVEELRVQAKLYGRDTENFKARNRWFNKALVVKMAEDYIKQLRNDAQNTKKHKCKGVDYIKFDRMDVFYADINKKIVSPMITLKNDIERANTPEELYKTAREFKLNLSRRSGGYKQCAGWKDAYKGMGAYATMQNLLRFHGCTFPKDNDFYKPRVSGLKLLESAAATYQDGEGWKLHGLMKQMIADNDIDIHAKMEAWAAAKEARNLKR